MYWWRNSLLALTLLASLSTDAIGTLIVDPPRPITHRVSVRIVETALDDGTSPATVFGDSSQRADIEASIDAIWAQAGIDIQFLDPIVRYNNTFAYQGIGGVRPGSDLNLILNSAKQAGISHPDPSVINLFFVSVVPGFGPGPETWIGGSAKLSSSGVAVFVGDNHVATNGGHDLIASVVAHEIGHNLGLIHAANGLPNLMSAKRTSHQFSQDQIEAIFQTTFRSDFTAYIPAGGTGFPQLIEALPGDYNRNGIVDTGDYTLWRDNLGSGSLVADGNGDERIDQADYFTWIDNFGAELIPLTLLGDYNGDGNVDSADYTVWRDTLGSREDLAADGNGNQVVDADDFLVWKTHSALAASGQSLQGEVPEPATFFLLAGWTAAFVCQLRRRTVV